jgi:hypothetical protein
MSFISTNSHQSWAILVRTSTILRTTKLIADLRTEKVAELQSQTFKMKLSQFRHSHIFSRIAVEEKYF